MIVRIIIGEKTLEMIFGAMIVGEIKVESMIVGTVAVYDWSEQ